MADELTENEESVELTDEELDRIADTAISALQDILKYFDVGEVTIDEYEGDEGELILDITGNDRQDARCVAVPCVGHHRAHDRVPLSGHRGRRGLQRSPAREA